MAPLYTIRNASIVEVGKGVVSSGCSVVLREGTIGEITHAVVPEVGEIVDAAGFYLCPGLIDAHAHFFLDAGGSPGVTYLESDDQVKMECARRNAQTAIEAGITMMRDCGGPADLMFRFQRETERGEWPGPHIVSCGCPLTRPRGHCHFMGGEVATVEEVRRSVEWQLGQGASFVKVMASGGGLTPGTDPYVAEFPTALLKAASETAHAHGAKIAAHCHATESIVRALDVGVDIIEHAGFMVPPGKHHLDDAVVLRIVESGVVVCPTITSAVRTADHFRRRGRGHNLKDSSALERLQGRLINTRHFRRLGVRIVAGTDCGVTQTPFDSLVDELVTYTQLGFSNQETLRVATAESAAILNVPRVGELKVGYRADLILTAANPLEDLNALREPLLVFKSGNLVHSRLAGEAGRAKRPHLGG